MSDEQDGQVGFFRGLWAVGRGLFRALGRLLSGMRRLFAFGARRVRNTGDDKPDCT